MSLLLDALKKAEKAKDDAKRRAEAPLAISEGAPRGVRTRNDLPDISQPLEIHSEDIPGAAALSIADAKADALSVALDAARSAYPSEQTEASTAPSVNQAPRRRQYTQEDDSAPDPQASQRAAAKSVFEAKFREPNPKIPFYITMAVLGVFAIGTVVYFWFQLRPPAALVNANPKPPSQEKSIAVADSKPSPTPQPASTAPSATVPASSSIPGLPPQPARTAPAEAPVAATNPPAVPAKVIADPAARAKSGESPAGRPKPSPTAQASQSRTSGSAAPLRPPSSTRTPSRATDKPADPSKVSINRAPSQVNPKLEAGWVAYNQGNLQVARTNYFEVLRDEPANRDALLGMAALEIRANRPELAEIHYQKLLETDPRDAYAQAGLLALRAQMTDPVQAESRAKNILSSDPQAYVLHFTLGNQYAQQGRWPEAQQAFFKAFSADPENPDFAYNLAVSLDHVRQPGLALEYYRRAITLAQQRSSNFDQNLARNRVQELTR